MSKIVHMMVGLPGSGKSTISKNLIGTYISPDCIREEFCAGDRSDQSKNRAVWDEAYCRVQDAMINDEDIIFDATMLRPKFRKDLIDLAKLYEYDVWAHVVDKSIETCKKQNKSRVWAVPEHVIDRMADQFVLPRVSEGIKIIIEYKE